MPGRPTDAPPRDPQQINAAHHTCLAHRLRRGRTMMLDHLAAEYEAVFSFLFDPALDATNWRAEHALRPAVITRKMCGGGNRTTRGAQTQQVLASGLRTAQQRGVNPTDALTTLRRAPKPVVLDAFQPAARLH